jgi:hypothetical protein
VVHFLEWGRFALAVFVGAALLAGTAVAGEAPVAGAVSEQAKPASRVSPHVLAALRRAQQGDAATPRVGLQSQMQKQAARRHLPSARRGT